jgi:hypothetical protein
MDFKLVNRTVGEVEVLELMGNFLEDQHHQSVLNILESKKARSILFIIREKTQIDEDSIQTLLESAARAKKTALILHNENFKALLTHKKMNQSISVFDTERDAAFFFGQEFVDRFEEDIQDERRKHQRLTTVLPLLFCFADPTGKRFEFTSIVTNLSQGGLMAQFIETESELRMKQIFNPLDLQMLSMDLYLAKNDSVTLKGKVAHGNLRDGKMGIEFYDIPEASQNKLQEWIEKQKKLRSMDRYF